MSIAFTALTSLASGHAPKVFLRLHFPRVGTELAYSLREINVRHKKGGNVKSIFDPSFRYTRSVDTDLRKTFARVRREQRRQQNVAEQASAKVLLMKQQGRFGGR